MIEGGAISCLVINQGDNWFGQNYPTPIPASARPLKLLLFQEICVKDDV